MAWGRNHAGEASEAPPAEPRFSAAGIEIAVISFHACVFHSVCQFPWQQLPVEGAGCWASSQERGRPDTSGNVDGQSGLTSSGNSGVLRVHLSSRPRPQPWRRGGLSAADEKLPNKHQ